MRETIVICAVTFIFLTFPCMYCGTPPISQIFKRAKFVNKNEGKEMNEIGQGKIDKWGRHFYYFSLYPLDTFLTSNV